MAQTLEFSFDRPVGPEELGPLLNQSDWAQGRTGPGLETMLRMSSLKLGVWDDNRLVGFARVLSDGVYRCVIEDVIVDESYQDRGIGTRIMRTLMKELSGVEHVYLFTGGERLKQFYERLGFSLTPYLSMRILHDRQD